MENINKFEGVNGVIELKQVISIGSKYKDLDGEYEVVNIFEDNGNVFINFKYYAKNRRKWEYLVVSDYGFVMRFRLSDKF